VGWQGADKGRGRGELGQSIEREFREGGRHRCDAQ
jgi:hypothetical protein